MNIVAILYTAIITFVTGIIITNYSKIEQQINQLFIHIDADLIMGTTEKIILGVTYLSIPVVFYQLKKAKVNNLLNIQNNIISIKKTLICLISIILISKGI